MLSSVIVAAGRSVRYGQPAKVFEPLLGKPVLQWSIEAHSACPDVVEIVVVCRPEFIAPARTLVRHAGAEAKCRVVEGGQGDRQDSVRTGILNCSPDALYISIHDAARPGVTSDLISEMFQVVKGGLSAVAATRVKDTVKRVSQSGNITETLARNELWLAATPQMFPAESIRKAHEEFADKAAFTDDGSMVEASGQQVTVVETSERIRKLTTPEDLIILEALLGGQETRIGFGYDIHQTDANRELWLGGMRIQGGPGLLGHSDADVLLHAICDALLGAAALGDIGRHFPNTDPAYAGISSLKLLEHVRGLLAENGYWIVNIDATLIAERPKISPYVEQMQKTIADALAISPGAVGIKATTAEKMGPTGRGECMEAHAVANLKSNKISG